MVETGHIVPPELHQLPEVSKGWDGHSQFYANNISNLEELFGIVDLPWEDELGYIKDMTQPWAKGDHARPENAITLSGQQKQHTREIYSRMNLVDKVELPAGTYDGLILLGGLQSANMRCLDFLQDALHKDGVELSDGAKIALWGGVREIFAEKETTFLEDSLGRLSVNRPLRDKWLQGMVENPNIETETDGLRLGAYDKLGRMALHQIHLNMSPAHEEQKSNEPVVAHWDYDFNGHELVALNTGAVERPLGAARHTTEACAQQWAHLYGGSLPPNARIGFIVSQPYGLRTTRVVQQVLDEYGLQGVQLVGAGPAAPPTLGDHVFRGEIARNIYEDFKKTA